MKITIEIDLDTDNERVAGELRSGLVDLVSTFMEFESTQSIVTSKIENVSTFTNTEEES